VAINSSGRAAAERFKGFLRIASITHEGPKGTYRQAVDFLQQQFRLLAEEAKCSWLTMEVVELVEGKPILVVTLAGKERGESAILLNSHYDVVPVERPHWNTDPFAAVEDEAGNIYARGAQDMKCVCMQYVEAIGRLMKSGQQLKRDVHLTFVPDEEIGGVEGMARFVNTDTFKKLNVAMALDEGLANPTNNYTVFYGERAVWWCKVRAIGPTGHGSRFVKNTASEKLLRSLGHFMQFRQQQEERLHQGCQHAVAKKLTLGDVVTINITMLKAGVTTDGGKTYALNVIPMEAEAGFDLRIPPSLPLDVFESKLKEWTSEEGVSYEFVFKTPAHAVSSTDRNENVWWKVFEDTCVELGLNLEPEIFPAGTDSRYLRMLGIPSFGFSPMNNTPILLHDHNEYINVATFVKGIDVYVKVVAALANV